MTVTPNLAHPSYDYYIYNVYAFLIFPIMPHIFKYQINIAQLVINEAPDCINSMAIHIGQQRNKYPPKKHKQLHPSKEFKGLKFYLAFYFQDVHGSIEN